MVASDYWVAQWLDENEVKSEWEIDHILHTPNGIQSATDKAEEARESIEGNYGSYPDLSTLADSIVAGRRLDLSGRLSCPAYECQREDIDTTFKNVWHYFDNIVVEGASPIAFLHRFNERNHSAHFTALYQMREQARILLYLRSIGADRYIVFANKTFVFCQNHWLEHAKELGIAEALDENHDAIVRKIVESSTFSIEQVPGGDWSVDYTSSFFDSPSHLVLYGPERPTEEDAARALLEDFATATISDVELAKRLSLPLMEPTRLAIPNLKAGRTTKQSSRKKITGGRPTVAEVALNLRLPVFDHLSTEDLLKIREDERPDFEAFRSALRTAIQEKITVAEGDMSASTVARTVDEEYLRPGLAEIERKLRASKQAVLKKTALDLAIGTAAAGVAALSHVPFMIAGGAAALGSSVPLAPAVQTYIEDKRSARMSDLYFLWRVGKRAGH